MTIVLLIVYFVWYIPMLPLEAQIVLGIVMGIDFMISTVTGLIATLTNAADPNLIVGHNPEIVRLPPGRKHVIDEHFYCALCQVIV